MSLRHADARFLLPAAPRTAVVLGELDAYREGLQQAGVEVGAAGELAVAPKGFEQEAVASGAPMILLDGNGSLRPLRRAGFRLRRFLVMPDLQAPALIVPFGSREPGRYALERWLAPTVFWKRARNRIVSELLARDRLLPPMRALTLAIRTDAPPFLVAAAADLAVPRDAAWFLVPGQGDDLARGAFQLFERGAAEPSWALKFARVPDYAEPFDRDERGLARAAAAGETVAARAPRLLGRFITERLHASIETAAVGQRLALYLAGAAPQRAKREVVDDVASWVLEMGTATQASPNTLEPLRRELDRRLLSLWTTEGAPNDLLQALPPVPAVLIHHDLGSWNVVLGRDGFTVLDWESSRDHGPPLWDLVYFLADALATCDGARTEDDRQLHFVRLFRGDLASSALLFRWVRRAAQSIAIPPNAVAPLVTLLWLYEGSWKEQREAALNRAGATASRASGRFERLARLWLADPELGIAWGRWQ